MTNIDWNKIPEVSGFWKNLSNLYDIKPTTVEGHPLVLNPRKLKLSPSAEKLHMEFGNECFKLAAGEYTPIRPMVLKAEDNLLRIAATLTMWNNPHAEIIDSDTLEAASHLMEYHLKEGLRITEFSQDTTDNSSFSLASELLAWLKSTGRYLIHSVELCQKAPRPCMRKVREIDKLMGLLVEYGHALKLDAGTVVDGKSRKKAWLIVS